MRLQQWIVSGAVLAALAASFAFVPAQAADPKDNIQGVITSRSGDNLVLRDAGGNVIKITLTGSTTIYELQGPLGLGILPSSKPREILEPGLKVTVDILAGVCETGKKCATDFLENMRIVFDDHLPRWNYRALPQGQ